MGRPRPARVPLTPTVERKTTFDSVLEFSPSPRFRTSGLGVENSRWFNGPVDPGPARDRINASASWAVGITPLFVALIAIVLDTVQAEANATLAKASGLDPSRPAGPRGWRPAPGRGGVAGHEGGERAPRAEPALRYGARDAGAVVGRAVEGAAGRGGGTISAPRPGHRRRSGIGRWGSPAATPTPAPRRPTKPPSWSNTRLSSRPRDPGCHASGESVRGWPRRLDPPRAARPAHAAAWRGAGQGRPPCGGAGGARLLAHFHMPPSRATVLRLVTSIPIPDTPAPIQVGIDD